MQESECGTHRNPCLAVALIVGSLAAMLSACGAKAVRDSDPGAGGAGAGTGGQPPNSGGANNEAGGSAASGGSDTAGAGGSLTLAGGTTAETGGASGASAGTGGPPPAGGAGSTATAGAGGAGSSGAGGAPAGTGGQAAGVGGEGELGGEGGARPEFPWPDPPDERGVAVGVSGDPRKTGCCLYDPRQEDPACPLPDESSQTLVLEPMGDLARVTFTFHDSMNFRFEFLADIDEPIHVGAMLTDLLPPDGLVAASPVYWVGTEEPFPVEAAVSVVRSVYGMSGTMEILDARIFHSADGAEFEALEMLSMLIGPTASLPGPGFFLVGLDPSGVTCEP